MHRKLALANPALSERRSRHRRGQRWLAVAAGLVVGLGVSAPSFAAGKGGYGTGPRLERMIERLDLDEAQRTELFAVIDAARPEGRALREQVREAHRELRVLLAEPQVDERAVVERVEAIGALRTQLSMHRVRTWLELREQLSPEQREALAERMERSRSRRHGERRQLL